MTTAPRMGRAEWLLLILLSLLWGASFLFIGLAVGHLPTLTIVALRVALAALGLAAFLHLRGLRLPRQPAVWRAFLGMGLLNNVIPFCLIVWGQSQIAAGLAAILNATTPLFAVLAAHVLTADERLTPARALGVLAGFGGAAVMIGPSALAGGGPLLAQLAVLGAALSYGLAGIFGRRFRSLGVAPLATATGQLTASALLLVPLALLVDQPWTLAAPPVQVWAAILGLALVSTALAYVLYFRILSVAGATNLSLVTFLIPVSAILLGWLVLHERLEPRQFAGMALIALGLSLIDGRLWRLRR